MQKISRIDRLPPGDAVNRVNDSIKSLARNYANLFKLYVQDGSSLVARELIFGLAGGVLVLIGWSLFIVATVALAFPTIPFWASIGLWAVFHLGIGSYLFFRVRSDLKEESVPKAAPIEPLKNPAEANPLMYGGGFVP